MKTFYFALILLFLFTPQTYAHHSYQATFDNRKEITLSGTVTNVSWKSPHIEYSIETRSIDGDIQKWTIPTAAPGVARSNQLSQGTIEKGDLVTFSGWPARDGTQAMRAIKVSTENGTTYQLRPSRSSQSR